MKELSPAARALVDAHRSDRTLTPADRERIKNDVMLRVAALGATATVAANLTTKVAASGTAKSAGVSLASKLALVALSVTAVTGVVSVSVRAVRARAHANPAPSATEQSAVAPEPAPAASTAVVAAPATAPKRPAAAIRRVAVTTPVAHRERRPAVTPDLAAVPAGSAAASSTHADQAKAIQDPPEPAKAIPTTTPTAPPPPAASVVVPPDPEPELRVVRQARDDLRAGRPASAYRRLEEFDGQRGAGMLGEERRALSAIALCQWQPGPQARARAAAFLRSSPESPLAIRVRSACAQASKASP
ncbi:MAG TPA: hypothetical protein VHO67_22445 [Polyangia bacterium]|nr:hypothetical protein [Polyangia bacterium]